MKNLFGGLNQLMINLIQQPEHRISLNSNDLPRPLEDTFCGDAWAALLMWFLCVVDHGPGSVRCYT